MKAIQIHEFGGPDVLRYENVPDPTPGPDDVLIAVRAVGVNPVETYIRAGAYSVKPPFPFIPGSDAAGIVEAVGANVTAFKVGDRVYTDHSVTRAYAEKIAAPSGAVYPLPENTTFAQGAALGVPYATAYRALVQRGNPAAGDTVLVHGATGAVGIASVQIARALGLTVFGTGGTPEGLEVVRREGAHQVFNRKESDYLVRAKAATPGGKGFDIILEMLANVNLAADLPILAVKGRVIVIGSRGSSQIDARELMGIDTDIRGMRLPLSSPSELRGNHAALIAGLENGTLRPLIAQEFPLSEAADAHREVMNESGHAPGKIILVP